MVEGRCRWAVRGRDWVVGGGGLAGDDAALRRGRAGGGVRCCGLAAGSGVSAARDDGVIRRCRVAGGCVAGCDMMGRGRGGMPRRRGCVTLRGGAAGRGFAVGGCRGGAAGGDNRPADDDVDDDLGNDGFSPVRRERIIRF